MIQLYAKRRLKKGFAFTPDTYLQYELESSFIFEDTPDQEKTTKAIKMYGGIKKEDLKQENVESTEFGLELTMLDNRLSFDLALYEINTIFVTGRR